MAGTWAETMTAAGQSSSAWREQRTGQRRGATSRLAVATCSMAGPPGQARENVRRRPGTPGDSAGASSMRLQVEALGTHLHAMLLRPLLPLLLVAQGGFVGGLRMSQKGRSTVPSQLACVEVSVLEQNPAMDYGLQVHG